MPNAEFDRLAVTYVPATSLHPFPGNARTHSRNERRKLRDSIRKNEWTVPILVDEVGMILAGHCRWEVAQELGLAKVPVIRVTGWSEAQKKAYVLADNRIADEAGWDKDLLRKGFQDLLDVGFDLEDTGFDTIEIDRLLGAEDFDPKVASDDVHLPDGEYEPVSQLGDSWHIGEQRLEIGDARDPLVYERLLAGERAQLIFTDPPYGCAIEGNVSGLGKVKHKDFVMGTGETSLGEFALSILRPAFKAMAAHASPGAIAFVCTDWRCSPHLLDAASGVFAEHKNTIVWVKTNAGMGTFYRSQHEFIHAFKVSAGETINNFGLGEGGRHRSNVWTYPGANTFRRGRMEDLATHSTVKPKKLVADAILDCSRRGGIVLDPFLGSGTTLVAAHSAGRRGYGVELDPLYGDAIIKRVSEAVGRPALLDGQVPFDQVAADRFRQARGA